MDAIFDGLVVFCIATCHTDTEGVELCFNAATVGLVRLNILEVRKCDPPRKVGM